MAQDYTTTGLLAEIKRRGMLPSTAETLSTTDFLAMATGEMQTYLMALLLSTREEYAVVDYDVAITAGTATYAIPPRAIGDKVRLVLLDNGSGTYVPLQRVEPEHAHEAALSGSPTSFYLADDNIVLVPSPTSGANLRVKYYRRPNALVATTACATISSINVGRTVITTSSTIPSTFTSGVVLDIVDATPGFRTLVQDAATTGTVSGTTVTLSTALPSTVTAGDYVCLAGEAPVPQIPVELHPLLAQRTVVKALEALAPQKVKAAVEAAKELEKLCLSLIAPRTEGQARYLINRNGPGFGGGRAGRLWRRWP